MVTPVAEGPYVEEDFEVLFRREYKAVVGLAYVLSGRRWAAEDLAQDAFLAAHRHWKTVRGSPHPGAFVRKVVADLAVSHRRRLGAEARAVARLALRLRTATEPLDAPDAEFWKAVRSLPARQAQVVALHYLEDLPAATIAAILGGAEATVHVHLHRGRLALARRLNLREETAP